MLQVTTDLELRFVSNREGTSVILKSYTGQGFETTIPLKDVPNGPIKQILSKVLQSSEAELRNMEENLANRPAPTPSA